MDIINFKKLFFKNSNLDFNNDLFMDYFVKQVSNYDFSIWLIDNYNIYNKMNKLLQYLNKIPNVVKFENIDFVEKIETNINVKYRKVDDKILKITKLRDAKKIDGYQFYLQKNITNITTVDIIPLEFNKKVEKVYYKINEYMEIVVTKFDENIVNNNFVKINILNKHLYNDFIFISLYKLLFTLFTIIYKKSSVFSEYLEKKLLKFFMLEKNDEMFLTFENLLNGSLLTSKDCNYRDEEKYFQKPTLMFSYPIVNKNDFYILFNTKYKLIFTFDKSLENIDIIPLDINDIWLTKEEELEIIFNLEKLSDNYLFAGYVDYNKNKAYVYDVYKFENLRIQINNIDFKNRYNYIDIVLSKIPVANFIFERIEINPVSSKEKIYENYKYMINSNSIGYKYVSNDIYKKQLNYSWIFYNYISIPLYVKDKNLYIMDDNKNYLQVDLVADLKYEENRNYIFIYDLKNVKLIQTYQNVNTIINEQQYENFLKYIQFTYDPNEVILENNFNIKNTILWKLQLHYKCLLINSLNSIEKVYKKGYVPIVNDIKLFNSFVKSGIDKPIGILYLDDWKCKKLNLKDKDLEKIDICKIIDIDKMILKYRDKFIINFDDHLNFSCINNLPNVISILILTISENTYIPLTPSQNRDIMESKIIFSDLKTFAKHHKLRKNISILKKSEILELIQTSGYTLNDVKIFVENEKIEKKKSLDDGDSSSSCSEKQEGNCENSEFNQYMYTDAEMEFYRKYVRQCTSQLKQTAFKRNLIDSLEYNIDRKSLICLLVKKQCKSDTKIKPVVKKIKTKIQSIFPDETYQLVSDIYKTEQQNYQCKGYNIINYKGLLLLRCDNNDIIEFMFLTSNGFNFLGNNEKDFIVRSFKNLVKNCLDSNKLYNILTNGVYNITNEFENSFKQLMNFDIYRFYENDNILYNFIVYSLFFGIWLNIYEYTESYNAKLLFSSEKIQPLYDNLKKTWPKNTNVYNIIIISNAEKIDFGYHIQRVSNNIIFTSNNLLQS